MDRRKKAKLSGDGFSIAHGQQSCPVPKTANASTPLTSGDIKKTTGKNVTPFISYAPHRVTEQVLASTWGAQISAWL